MGVLGIHDSAEDQEELYIVEIESIRIAILNYTYGTNGIAMPKDNGSKSKKKVIDKQGSLW